jgi:Ser/Thr protein kinase RdoA (MazF antagonist)
VAGEPLTGGRNTASVVRVGETVRRSRSAGSQFAARLLAYLNSIGYPYAPRYLGTDAEGRDVLAYVPGATTDHPDQWAAGAYAAGGRMLRELHDATAGHPLAGSGECVLHSDPGPFNTIFRDGMPVALIDWDSCGPGARLSDLGYMAWTWCIQAARNVPPGDQARHLRELRDGYGRISGEELLAAVVRSQTRIAELEAVIREDRRTTRTRREHARQAIDWATGDRDLVEHNKALFLTALR